MTHSQILITGASGFLGSRLATHFQDAGYHVALLLRPSSQLTALEGRSFEIARVETVQQIIDAVCALRPRAIIHAACAYGRRGETLLDLTDANLRLGIGLVQALESLPDRPLFLNAGTALAANVSDYALSKHQFAQWGHRRARTDQRFRFVNVELQQMLGPGDDPTKFTTHVIRACLRNDTVLELTAGEQRRDIIYIDDVLDGFRFLLERSSELDISMDVPLGSGVAPTVREYVELVHRTCRSRTELHFGAIAYRPAEEMLLRADLSLMRNLGWAPKWSLEEAIRYTIRLEGNK